MAQSSSEGVSESVQSVRFSFMTAEEVRGLSVVKITNPILLDSVGRPVPGGLYDPAMGPIDYDTICKTCEQRDYLCPAHCGHIDLISPVYNPLLFHMLHTLLQRTCFFCLRFRASRGQVERCAAQLDLIRRGDIHGAKMLDSCLEDGDSSSSVRAGVRKHSSEHSKKGNWTSLQLAEATSALDKFLKLSSSECKNCNAKNPKISKPTFGWFHMRGISSAQIRANIIRGCKLGGPYAGGVEEKSSSEVVNGDDYPMGNGLDDEGTDLYASDGAEDFMTKRIVIKGEGVPSEFIKQKTLSSENFLPSEVRGILKILWENEARLCSFICDIQQEQMNSFGKTAGYSMFFIDAVVVPPIKFRPAAMREGSIMEHSQTVLLGKVLQSNLALLNAHANKHESSKVVSRWIELQQSVNVLFDSKTATGLQKDAVGICQLLEKKEGVFRQKMMGKRVNYACRSVISPDPYLAVNEIGIPPVFAKRLTYPERVTPWNTDKLRGAIVNGSETHPGATHYIDKLSTAKLPFVRKKRIAISRKLLSSRGVVTQSGKSCDHEFEGKVVYRHLKDGDVVLLNRQPTLHKTSIMAHIVRVLKGEKTLRMHYANCSSYNADFDGDEMNVHLPQDEISRSEAYNIVNANNQYIVPTRGDTIRGLIQDHIVSAVLLTMKNTFLTWDDYNQLLYSSGVFAATRGSFSGNHHQKISVVHSEVMMQHVLPAVWKPKPLWTGKQVITALLNHLTRNCKPFTVEHEGKIPRQYFARNTGESQFSKDEEENDEHNLLIWKNELVRGVIDKAQFGRHGLVHTVQELYGSNTAGILLSAFSRLFTVFLQTHGFTCGVDDLLILPHIDKQMTENLVGDDVGEEVHREFVNSESRDLDTSKLQFEIEKAICRNGQSANTFLDLKMKSKLNAKGSKISKDLLLKGLLKPFPRNCISLMTITGAKGSTVNFQQISSFLGQQELEGKRVPRMVSGKTLPCFVPWDFASRAGGYIIDRFLTGLRPQEYYFHCMAGREGLVDTAVKTSRSGYLQRCLVKNLECLKVCYDYTVRDADGSIIQFQYGEDGVDVLQTSFLTNFEALATNQEIISQKFHHQLEVDSYMKKLPEGLRDKVVDYMDELAVKKKFVEPKDRKHFLNLMKRKYLSSLAQAGEPVGVIAAQSVGEPSTQMTLNTFHLAGRGEMNVTLGIPRLQEILMTASSNIKTPITTCPLLEGRDPELLVEKLKLVTVADILESIEVRVIPLSIENRQICRLYKLIMKLRKPKLVSVEECEEVLEVAYLRELEDAIQNHLLLLSKISGIKNFVSKTSKKKDEEDGESRTQGGKGKDDDGDNDDDDDDDDGDEGDDLGFDGLKSKKQSNDELEYEDDDLEEEETDQGEETDRGEVVSDGDEIGTHDDVEDVVPEKSPESKVPSKAKSKFGGDKEEKPKKKKKTKRIMLRKDTDRSIFVEAKGLHFEVHFKFTNEPHLLLAQIAQKIAKNVHVKSSGNIGECQIIEYDKNEQVIWKEEKNKKPTTNKDGGSKSRALQTVGIDFHSIWNMQDELDITRVYSNNIHALLMTYGVEAARATIVREVKHVFNLYGVEINYRHLSLIADYMTFAGGYRPMSRFGGIAESISPFLKMSFETASKFIVEAACHGLTDNLETPSSRICLGLPVKMGTGCFDLMQTLEA